MRDLIDAFKAFLPDLYAWSPLFGSTAFAVAWLLLGAVVWYVVMYRPGAVKLTGASQDVKTAATTPQPSQTITNSPGAMQAGRDINVNLNRRDQQQGDARHLMELQGVLRQDADKLKRIAEGMRSSGTVISVYMTDAELKDAIRVTFVSHEVLDPDLANHYREYATKKADLVREMEEHAREFSTTALSVLQKMPTSVTDLGDRENVAVSVVMRCVLSREVMVLQESSDGRINFSTPRASWRSDRGQRKRFVEMERAYHDFKADRDFIEHCENLKRRALRIAEQAAELRNDALRLASQQTLSGSCEFTQVN